MSEENLYTFENPEYRKTYWHTCSHIMAQAVKRLWPEVQLAIGPAIDEGWYYDFDAPFSFTPDHLAKIEAEMKKICKERIRLERSEKSREDALAWADAQNEPYKRELIEDLPADAVISFYTQGEFTDLCAGPHLDHTGRLRHNGFKLPSPAALTGAATPTVRCSREFTASASPARMNWMSICASRKRR